MNTELPRFHEHDQDSLIPPNYGIDENHDGGFYPYRIAVPDHLIVYMTGFNGLDIRCGSYEQARDHIVEVNL